MFEFDRGAALEADRSDRISESGYYTGKITRFIQDPKTSGAVMVVIDFESDDSTNANYVSLCIQKKNGDVAFGAKHIQALMGLLKIPRATPVKKVVDGKEELHYDCFCNKSIGFGLQKCFRADDNSKYKFELKHFFDKATGKTFSELANNTDAKICKVPILDKVEKAQQRQPGWDDEPFPSGNVSDADLDAMFGPVN